MRKVKVYRYVLAKVGLLILLVTGCSEWDETYSSRPGLRLGFSVDTLSFDTVFTTIGSATRQFMVYNTNKEALLIRSVRLAKGGRMGFRLNVDGHSGESFSDIRVEGRDSLYVFVEVTVDPVGADQPLLIEDRIEFTVNSTTQSLLLQAYGQDVNLYKGGLVLTQDTLWTAERPYLIYDSIVVGSGMTLTIEKGASLYMHNKAKWIIDGRIKAIGTLEQPIVFRGDRLDDLLTDLPYDRIANQWDGLYFGAASFGNEMNHVVIRNGEGGLRFLESLAGEPKLRIENSQITNMEQSVLEAVNCTIEAINTEFSNATQSILSLSGGDYHFIHCTVANYYIINPGRMGMPVLSLKNYTGDEQAEKKPLPLNVVFDNCLIDGSFSEGNTPLGGELLIDKADEGELNYRFNHCAIKTMKIGDTCFVNTQFIHKDHPTRYKSIGNDENNYSFDFRPDTTKAVIGKADPALATRYPLDRLGIDRTVSEDGPDIGAYEYVPDPEKENES
ncbi:MAG: hypothetical protein LBS88_09230 [Tannerellaceae bacterium]|jgi:hypothetical protein|nr:hypothetical protein [Tannerellaceae bacterium]